MVVLDRSRGGSSRDNARQCCRRSNDLQGDRAASGNGEDGGPESPQPSPTRMTERERQRDADFC